jgi:hypothetical protein|tara:strand:- start:2783 stop:3022 length:240 start_codon:yes stop_codon:yes gene_type:complete
MDFTEITDELNVFPGEYVYHEPTKSIVMVGAFNQEEDFIRGLRNGSLMEDKISHFKKINLTKREARLHNATKCSSCKGS